LGVEYSFRPIAVPGVLAGAIIYEEIEAQGALQYPPGPLVFQLDAFQVDEKYFLGQLRTFHRHSFLSTRFLLNYTLFL
jgi:hypothetical protein